MADERTRLERILDRLFVYEPIGRSDVTYLDRWVIARIGPRRLYLHHFRCDDSEAVHNHPRTFVSFLFWGSYREETPGPGGRLRPRTLRAPHLRRFAPEHAHRITRCRGAWSLVLVGRRRRDWGFRSGDRWVPPGAV